jgi:hydrogenase maturation protease
MPNLGEQLESCLQRKTCFVGLGNVDYGDDGFGVRLAEQLAAVGMPDVMVAGTTPERWVTDLAAFDSVIFLDAVDFGAPAGFAVFLDSAEITARFPQISTHKMSLGLLAKLVESGGSTKAWLLGVQPESLNPGQQLRPTVATTLEALLELLCVLKLSTGHVETASPGCAAEHSLGNRLEVNAC